jgi:LmbE family N-acetylglucosaminyl deacetylase
MKRILVISAHPDDEVLGCGGTITKYAKAGYPVYSLILGEGITSRYKDRKEADRTLIEKLRQQALKVAKVLGIKKTLFFNLPDNRFDTIALLDIIKIVEDIKKKIRPHIVFTHSSSDLNIDHQIVYKAVMTAFRPEAKGTVDEIYSFEIPSSTGWLFSKKNLYAPNFYENIEDFIDTKIKALSCYKGELREWPHPRSIEGIKTFAKKRGLESGLKYAEAFEFIRGVRR